MPLTAFTGPIQQATQPVFQGASIVPQNAPAGTPLNQPSGQSIAQSGNIPGGAPVAAGSVYNSTTGITQSSNPTTLTANVSTPSSLSSTIPAPAVITPSQAQSDIGNVGTQISNLNADAAAQSAAKAPVNPANSTTNNSSTVSGNAPVQTPAPTVSGNASPDLDSQITDILSQLTSDENTAQTTSDATTVTDANGNKVSIPTALDENAQAEAAAQAQTTQALTSIANGTYPLSAPEQQLLASTTAQYQQLIQGQRVANTAYQGSLTELMASLGIETSAPTESLGMAQQAISVGQNKIADLDTKMATAVSNLQISFQKQDTTAIQDNWNTMSKAFDDRTAALQKIQTDMATAVKNQQDELQNTAKEQISGLIASGKADATAAQNAIDNAYKAGMLTIAQKKLLNSQANSALGGGTSPVTNPNGVIYNVPASIAPYASFATNGAKYVDLSAFAGTPTEKNQAVQAAEAAGYKVITNKNTALDLQNIDNATANLQSMKNAFDPNTADSAAARNAYKAQLNNLESFLQTNPSDAAIGTFNDTALDILKAISGVQGFRGGASAIEQVRETLPQLTDTQAVVDQKIANIQTLINNRENALVGQPSATDQSLNDNAVAGKNVNDYVTANPAQAQTIASLYNVPGATDASVYAYLQQSGKISPTGGATLSGQNISAADMRTLYTNAKTKSYASTSGNFVIDGKTYTRNTDGSYSAQ